MDVKYFFLEVASESSVAVAVGVNVESSDEIVDLERVDWIIDGLTGSV